jgi:hypothetical protein
MAGSTVLCHRHLLMIALMTNCSDCRGDQRAAVSDSRIPALTNHRQPSSPAVPCRVFVMATCSAPDIIDPIAWQEW